MIPRLALLLLAALALYVAADGRPETAAGPSRTAVEAWEGSETSTRPLAASGAVLTPLSPSAVGGGGAFPAAAVEGSPPSPPRPLSKAEAGGHRTFAPTGPAADPPLAVGPVCSSPCAVDVSEWDQPTPEPRWTFNGLRPIAESWNVGVASGKASHVGAGFPSWYLALPIGPGFRVRIVGPGGEVTRVSTDAGPALHLQRPPDNRIADLSVPDFVHVCGVPASFGLCPVSVTVLGRSR